MRFIYPDSLYICGLIEYLGDCKNIMLDDMTLSYFVKDKTLVLANYLQNFQKDVKTAIVEDNLKPEFDVCIDSANKIHLVYITLKYELMYATCNDTSWHKELLYNFDSEIGIPKEPVIKAYNGCILIIVSFNRKSINPSWSLWSYRKIDGKWIRKNIDKAYGICSTQHSLCIDANGNANLVYRYINDFKDSYIKYLMFNHAAGEWIRPKVIASNCFSKYLPYVFVNAIGKTYILWLEINDLISLCCIERGLSGNDCFKATIDITTGSISLWDSGKHVYLVSHTDKTYCYDMCCAKQENCHLLKEISDLQKEGECMDSKVKLVLDIKKEFEWQINKLNEQNISLKYELEQKSKKIGELLLALKGEKEENQLYGEESNKIKEKNTNILEENNKIYNFKKLPEIIDSNEKMRQINIISPLDFKSKVKRLFNNKIELLKKFFKQNFFRLLDDLKQSVIQRK